MIKRCFSLLIFVGIFLSSINSFADDVIKIASWNIQNFGKSKAENDKVMKVIASTLSQFDIIAIQEISNLYEKSDKGCPQNEDICPGDKRCNLVTGALKKYLHAASNKEYEFMLSPQVKDERYLFIYDKNKIRVLVDGKLVKDDGDDKDTPICDSSSSGNMSRQPFYATFKAGSFDFTLATAHTSPSNNVSELNALYDFYNKIQRADKKEKDVILLGDLNADCAYLRKSADIKLAGPKFTWIIDKATDTTVRKSRDCAYDRIIFTGATAEDYAGKYGVLNFDEVNNIGEQAALKVSDHYPVWAEFYTDKDTDHK